MFIKNKINIFNLIQIFSLLIIILITLLVLKPAVTEVRESILNQRDSILDEVEELTGLRITYESMSPLIMNYIELNNVNVKSVGGISHGNVKRVIVSLDLFSIFSSSGDIEESKTFVESVVFIGGNVNLNINDLGFIEKLTDIGDYQEILVTRISVKKIDVKFDYIDGQIYLDDLKGSFASVLSRYHLKLNSKIRYYNQHGLPFERLDGNLKLNSYLSDTVEELTSSVELTDILTDIGKVKDLSFKLDLFDGELAIKNLNKKFNLDYFIKIKIPLDEVFFSVKGKSFKVDDLFIPEDSYNILDPFRDSIFIGEFKGLYNIKNNTFLYSSLGKLNIEHNDIPFPLDLDFHVIGDLDYLTVYSLNGRSKKGEVSYSGGINLHNYFPQGRLLIKDLSVADNLNINSDIKINVINSNFIGLDCKKLNISGIDLNNFSSIIYVGENDISFQGLKREGKGKISLSGSYNITTGGLKSYLNIHRINPSIIKDLIPLKGIKDNIANYLLTVDGEFSSIENKYNYKLNNFTLFDQIANEPAIYITGRGNEKKFSIDDLLIKYNGVNLVGRIDGDIYKDEIVVNSDTLINGNNYEFTFNIEDNRVKASGSYGLKLELFLGQTLYIDLITDKIPINYRGFNLAPTINLKTAIVDNRDFLFSLTRFETVISHEGLPYSPTLRFNADGTNRGININNIYYSDNVSPLVGDIELSRDSSGIITFNAGLNSAIGEEYYINSVLSSKTEMLNLNININNSSLKRLQNNRLKGLASINLNFLGSMDSFKGKGNVDFKEIEIDGAKGALKLNFSLSEKLLSLSNLIGNYEENVIKAPLLTYNFLDGRALGKIDIVSKINQLSFKTDLTIDLNTKPIENLLKIDKSVLEKITGKISVGSLYADNELLFTKKSFRIFNNRSALQIFSVDRKVKFFYSYVTGLLSANLEKPYFLSLNAKGHIKDDLIDVQLRNIDADAQFVNLFIPQTPDKDRRIIDLSLLNIKGQIGIKGQLENPLFNGVLFIDSGYDVAYIPEEIKPSRLTIKINDNRFSIIPNKIKVGETGEVRLKGELLLDSWFPESVSFNIDIPKIGKIPLYYKYDRIISDVKLYSSGLDITWEESGIYLKGKIIITEGDFYSDVTGPVAPATESTSSAFNYFIDIVVEVGNNNELYIPNKSLPILKATLTPGEVVEVNYSSLDESFLVLGGVKILDGELKYSGKPFTITEGRVILNLSPENLNPYIKLVAANSLIDENRRPVEVILTYEGGLLTEFKPRFSSVPSKSEEEILKLIGLSITDSNVENIISNADIITDELIGKPLEDALKKMLGVDFVTFETEALSSIITNISQDSESEYNDPDNLSKILNNTSLSLGNFITKDFYITGSVGTTYIDDELGMNVAFGVELNTPHFLLGFNMNHNLNQSITQPEFMLSLNWVLNPW